MNRKELIAQFKRDFEGHVSIRLAFSWEEEEEWTNIWNYVEDRVRDKILDEVLETLAPSPIDWDTAPVGKTYGDILVLLQRDIQELRKNEPTRN